MSHKQTDLCQSCSGPLSDFKKEEIIKEGFCPYCVNEKGELKSYSEILAGMIEYIKNDHPEIEDQRREEQAVTWLRDGPIWGKEFRGKIIEESLEDTGIINDIEVISTKKSEDNDENQNHGFPIWTLTDVRFFRTELDKVVDFIKTNIKSGPWWADFSSEDEIYIVFKDKVFSGNKNDTRFKKNANEYAEKMGCPENQFPFSDVVTEKNRQYKGKEWIG